MITFTGNVLALWAKINPLSAQLLRKRVILHIMGKYSEGWSGKLKIMHDTNRFFATMSNGERAEIIDSMGIPVWSNNGIYRGML